MQKLILAALLIVSPALCWGRPFVLDLPEGTHDVRIVVGADGSITAVPLQTVTLGKPGPKPPPVDPADPFVEEVRKQTAAVIAAGGSRTTAAAISAGYSLVSSAVADGTIAPAKAFEATKAATDAVLSAQADREKWTKWRADIGSALTTLQGQGLLNTKDQIAGVLKEIAKGMDLASGNSLEPTALAKIKPGSEFAFDTDGKADGILDGIDLAKLIELIRMIVELLKLFGIGG